MGREAKPLITRALEPVENHVEVFIAESRLAHSATNNPSDIEEEQLMTLLVSFDPQPAQRWSARALASTFITAQCIFEQLPDNRELDEWLGDLLHSRVPASLCIVLVLPEYSENSERQVKYLLSNLKCKQVHDIHMTVAVSSTPSDWRHCTGIGGFVSAVARDGDRASLQVFNMLAALMAPGLSSCVDWDELRSIFGSHEFPSRLASGIWLRAEATFVPGSAEDQKLIEDSKVIAFMPSHPLQFSSQNKMMNAIHKFTANDPDFVMITPYGMSSEPVMSDQIVPVFLISAPLAEITFES